MIKKIYENQSEIPAGLEDHYTEKDGKWHLQVEGGWKADEDVTRVQKALNDERRLHGETKKKAKSLEELEARAGGQIDVERYIAIIDAAGDETEIDKIIAKLKAGGSSQEQINRAVERERNRLNAEKANVEQERDRYKTAHENSLIEAALTTALIKHKVDKPGLMQGAKALLRSKIKIEIGADGQSTIKAGDLEEPVDTFVENWVTTDEGRAFRTAPANGGGGAGGGSDDTTGGPNPWDPATLNLTKQMEIYRKDPTRAKAMAARHGVSL